VKQVAERPRSGVASDARIRAKRRRLGTVAEAPAVDGEGSPAQPRADASFPAPGEVVRLTQDEVEAHPEWRGLGRQADKHPPLRGWLATPVCSEDAGSYGLLQLSDKAGGADFTEEDADTSANWPHSPGRRSTHFEPRPRHSTAPG
jgi:hypothetical protein